MISHAPSAVDVAVDEVHTQVRAVGNPTPCQKTTQGGCIHRSTHLYPKHLITIFEGVQNAVDARLVDKHKCRAKPGQYIDPQVINGQVGDCENRALTSMANFAQSRESRGWGFQKHVAHSLQV